MKALSRSFTWISHGVALLPIIIAPTTLRTQRRSLLYIYKELKRHLLHLQAIRMPPQAYYMLGLT
jgi:hypothetical protein